MRTLFSITLGLFAFSSFAFGQAHYDIVNVVFTSISSGDLQTAIYFHANKSPISFSCQQAQCFCEFDIPIIQEDYIYHSQIQVPVTSVQNYLVECPASWLYSSIPPGTTFHVSVIPGQDNPHPFTTNSFAFHKTN